MHIQKGKVKVIVLSDLGKEAVVGLLGPGQFFGEGCMNGHKLRIATAAAVDRCVKRDAMLATLHNEPKFSEMFMAYLLTRNSRIEDPDRSTIQFERKAACAHAFAAREFRDGGQPAANQSEH